MDSLRSTTIEQITIDFKARNEVSIRQYYEQFRVRFINYFRKNHQLSGEEIIEMYQKAFTILYQNVVQDKIATVQMAPETYLIGIGKNLIKEAFRESQKHFIAVVEEESESIDEVDEQEDLAHKRDLVRKILKGIGEPCRSILTKYYFHNYSMESIARDVGYKSEGVAKKKKCQCLQMIREQLLKETIDKS